MPPFLFDNFVWINLVHGPHFTVGLVEEDTLEYVVLVFYWCYFGIMIHPKLMLIVRAAMENRVRWSLSILNAGI